MEAITLGGLIGFVLVMLAPVAVFVWAMVDIRRKPTMVKALIKIGATETSLLGSRIPRGGIIPAVPRR